MNNLKNKKMFNKKNKKNKSIISIENFKEENEENKISVLILTHNKLKIVRKCFNSIKRILERDDIFELIILDNNSIDGTKEFLQEFSKSNSKIKTFFSSKNLGCAGGRKFLLKIAKGNIILILDSDVIIKTTNFIDRLLKALKKPGIGIVGFHGLILKDMSFVEMPESYEGEVDFVSGYCQMFEKKILESCMIDDYYSPYFAEDADFCYQIKKIGLISYTLPTKTSGLIHEWGKTNIGNKTENERKLRYLFKKFNLYSKEKLIKKIFRYPLIKKIDNKIGRLGLLLKEKNPKLYFKLKNLKNNSILSKINNKQ